MTRHTQAGKSELLILRIGNVRRDYINPRRSGGRYFPPSAGGGGVFTPTPF